MSSTPFPGTAPKDLKPGEEANLRAATCAPEAIVAPPGGTGGPVAWMRKNLFGSVREGTQERYWNVRVDLKPGNNNVLLDRRNLAAP